MPVAADAGEEAAAAVEEGAAAGSEGAAAAVAEEEAAAVGDQEERLAAASSVASADDESPPGASSAEEDVSAAGAASANERSQQRVSPPRRRNGVLTLAPGGRLFFADPGTAAAAEAAGPARPQLPLFRWDGYWGRKLGFAEGFDAGDRNGAVGAIGERLVYEVFRATLPGFGPECWKSRNRMCVGLAAPAHDSVADFEYLDVDGLLCDDKGAICYIEVRAHDVCVR